MLNFYNRCYYKSMKECTDAIKNEDPSNIINIIRNFQISHKIVFLMLLLYRVDSNTTWKMSGIKDKKNKIKERYGNDSNKLDGLKEKEKKILEKDRKPNASLDIAVFDRGLLKAAMDPKIKELMKKRTPQDQLYSICEKKLPSGCLFLKVKDKCDEICNETKLEGLEGLEKLEGLIILLLTEKAAFCRYIRSGHRLLLKRVRLRIPLTNMYLEVLEIIYNIILSYKSQIIEQERVRQDSNEYKRAKLELAENGLSLVSEMEDQVKRIQLICDQIKGMQEIFAANSQDIQNLNNRLGSIEKVITKLDLAIETAPYAWVVNRSDITRFAAVTKAREGYEGHFRSYLDELKNFDLTEIKDTLSSVAVPDDQWGEMDKRGETRFILNEDKKFIIEAKNEISKRQENLAVLNRKLEDDLEQNQRELVEICEKYNDYISTNRENLGKLGDNMLMSPIGSSDKNSEELISEINEKFNNLLSKKAIYENEIKKYGMNTASMSIEKVKDLWNQINSEWKGYRPSDTHSFADFKRDETKFQNALDELADILNSNEELLKEVEVLYREKTFCISDALAEMARDVISFVDQLKKNLNDLCINIQQESIVYEDEFWTKFKGYDGLENIKRFISMISEFDKLKIVNAYKYLESISVIRLKDPENMTGDDEFIREFLLHQSYLVEFPFKIKGKDAKIISNKKDTKVIDVINKIATHGDIIAVPVEVNPDGMLEKGKKINILATAKVIKLNTGKYFEKNLEGITNKANFEDSIFVKYGSDNWKELIGEKKNEIFGHNIGESIGTIFRYNLTDFNRRKERRINEDGIIILGFEIK